MSKWEMVKLGDVCDLKMGQSPDSSSYNQAYEGLPFYQGNADFGAMNPVTRYWCSKPNKTANSGDVLFSVRAPIGAINIATETCCIGRGLAALSVKEELCNRDYFRYTLISKRNEIISKGTGSTFKAINKAVLLGIEFYLPPLETQKKIADELDKIIGLIEKRKQQIEKLDLLVKTQFVELFGDPVENPMGWDMKKMSDITTSRLGKMLDAKKNTGESSFKYLANFNVQWFKFNLTGLKEMDFNDKDIIEFSLKKGDLLVCEGGEIGRCAVWNSELENCYFQKALHRVRCNENIINPYYLARVFYFKAKNTNFKEIIGSHATIPHLTGEKLKTLQIIVPPLNIQNQFAEFVESVEKSKQVMEKGLTQLDILYKERIQKYFD